MPHTVKEWPSPIVLISCFGFACFLASGTMIALGQTFVFGADSFLLSDYLFRLCAGLSFAFLLLSSVRILQRLIKRPSIKLMLIFSADALALPLMLLAGIASQFAPSNMPPATVVALLWFCMGVALFFQIITWGHLWSVLFFSQNKRHVFYSICLSVVLSGLIAYLFSKMDALPQFGVQICGLVLFLWLLSSACCYYCTRLSPDIEIITLEDFRTLVRKHISVPMRALRPGTAGFCLGTALFLLTQETGEASLTTVFSLMLCLAGMGYFFSNFLKKTIIAVSLTDKITHPTMCIAFALLPFTQGLAYRVLLGVIVLASLIFSIQNWCTLSLLLMRWKASPVYAFSSYTIFTASGLLLGWVGNPLLEHLGCSLGQLVVLNSLLVIVVTVITSVVLPYDNPLWDDINDFINGVETIALREKVTLPGNKAWYREKCLNIAERYHLTSREKTVFTLLAKGRNTEVISRELVISNHTAKTHIYHIYKKLEVQTQQDLIDMVEAWDVEA
jgi:DNA-binding CsgD family transcriptional regulator